MTREWQVRAVLSSAQNFLIDSSEETPLSQGTGTLHIHNLFLSELEMGTYSEM